MAAASCCWREERSPADCPTEEALRWAVHRGAALTKKNASGPMQTSRFLRALFPSPAPPCPLRGPRGRLGGKAPGPPAHCGRETTAHPKSAGVLFPGKLVPAIPASSEVVLGSSGAERLLEEPGVGRKATEWVIFQPFWAEHGIKLTVSGAFVGYSLAEFDRTWLIWDAKFGPTWQNHDPHES